MDFKAELIKLLNKETKINVDELSKVISVPPDPKLGDYAFPCFKLGGNPKDAAEKLKQKLKLPKSFLKVEVVGGYLNFFVNPKILIENTLNEISENKNNYGSAKSKKNYVVEFCSPNTNKPLHLGHIRNMSLGDSINRILKFSGNSVHPVEVVNNRGVHICKSMVAYKRWGNDQQPDKKSDHFVGDYYVIFARKALEFPELEQEAQDMLVKWEQGDKEVRSLMKKMNKWVLDGFNQTYKRFGIKFEKEYYETDFYQYGKDLVQNGLDKGIFIKDEKGSIIAPLENYGLGNKVLLRADGTSIYITQDMYLAQLRYDDFKFDDMIYVVASEQNLHFKQLFKILELLNKPYAKKMHHLSYGMVNLPSGRMKSREGTVVDADDLLDELSNLAEKEIRKRHSNINEKEIKERAEKIALGAVKFHMLKLDPVKDMIFNPEESISFEGDTGPYVQYTHARCCSILNKAKKEYRLKVSNKANLELLNENLEFTVVKMLYQFPDILVKINNNYKPHHLTEFLIKLAQEFNLFYHSIPVLSENKELMKSRLVLVDCVRQILENGLSLLGIEAPEEM